MFTTASVNPSKRITKWIFIGAAIIILCAGSAIYWVPQYQVSLLRERIESNQTIDITQRIQLEKDYVDYANKARTTLAQIVGGLLFLVTAGAAVWTAIAAQKNAQAAYLNAETAQQNLKLAEKTAQENLEHARDGKITERFSKAVEMLGSEKLEVRLGGIYALERIARDSQPDHWTVMEVLTAFIREKSKKEFQEYYREKRQVYSPEIEVPEEEILQFKTSTDIQAALSVIGRRNPKWIKEETDSQILDLSDSVLIGATLEKAILNRAFLWNVDLRVAHLYKTQLCKAFLGNTNLKTAVLRWANFSGASLESARNLDSFLLEGAIIDEDTKLPFNLRKIRPQLLENSRKLREEILSQQADTL